MVAARAGVGCVLPGEDGTVIKVRSATISPCGGYRTELLRVWDMNCETCAWICLNPSTADANHDDATVRKIIGFSQRWGYGGFVLFNVMSLRSTDPKALLTHPDPRGPDNSPEWIARRCAEVSADPPIVAWGAIHRRFEPWAAGLLQVLGPCRCLGKTKHGHPRHPLMLAYSTRIIRWEGRLRL